MASPEANKLAQRIAERSQCAVPPLGRLIMMAVAPILRLLEGAGPNAGLAGPRDSLLGFEVTKGDGPSSLHLSAVEVCVACLAVAERVRTPQLS